MRIRANPVMIGAFVIGAAVLIVVAIVVFETGRFFTKQLDYVLFFPDETLDGLHVGAPVVFRGVRIGQVHRIVMQYDEEELIRIPVFIQIGQSTLQGVESDNVLDPQVFVDTLVTRGLRGQLKAQSLVTGVLQIEFDMFPDSPVRLVGADEGVPELPTIRTGIGQFLEQFERIHFDSLAIALKTTLEDVQKAVSSFDVSETMTALGKSVQEFESLAANLNERIGPLLDSTDETVEALRATAESSKDLVQRADELLATAGGVQGPLLQTLALTLQEFEGAARALRVLADYLERNPDALIFGKGSGEE